MMEWSTLLPLTPSAWIRTMDFHFTAKQRFRLRQIRDATDDADILRRTLALLQLDQGTSVAATAAQLGVARQSIYNWLDRYLRTPTSQALSDHRGYAHVTAWDEDLLAVLLSALQQPPVHWGYRDQDWTVPLLRQHLARWDGRRWSETTLRRQLHRSGYVWKRPRYVLQPDPRRAQKIDRIRQRLRGLGPPTALLFEE